MRTNTQKPVPLVFRLPERYREEAVSWDGGRPQHAGLFSGTMFDVAFRGEVTSNADQRGAVWSTSVTITSPAVLTLRKFGRTGGIRAALHCMSDLIRVAVWRSRFDQGLEDPLPDSPKIGAASFSRPTMSNRRKDYAKRGA